MLSCDNELRDVIVNSQENIRNASHENANEKEDNKNSLEEDSKKDADDDDWRFSRFEYFQLLFSFLIWTSIKTMFCRSL